MTKEAWERLLRPMDDEQLKEAEKRILIRLCWKERNRDAYMAFYYPRQGKHQEGIFETAVLSNYPEKIVWAQTVAQ